VKDLAEQMGDAMVPYDVIVVGGGPSGFIAAVASARLGARTLLIERYGFLGGMPTAAALGPISPFHHGDEQVILGIPQEFVDRMVAAGGSTGHMRCLRPRGSGSYLCFFDREIYKWVALQMALEAGAELLLHSFVVDTIVEDGVIRGVVVVNKSGRQVYHARIFVDATGDADLVARAGARYVIGRDEDGALQPVTLMFEMAGVDIGQVRRYMEANPEDFDWMTDVIPLRPIPPQFQQTHFVAQGFLGLVRESLKRGHLYLGRRSVLFLTTLRPGVLHFNATRATGIDGTRVEDLTRAEIETRRQVMSLASLLAKYAPGFRDAYLSTTGTQVGVRESRHVLGEYILTADDVIRGRKFPDVVARGYFPIDIHDPRGGGSGTWLEIEDSYDIPYRCLIPQNLDRLLVAGRAISATHEAHGSFRTQGGVMAIGQAAGTAAALAAKRGVGPRQVPIEELQAELRRTGASLDRSSAVVTCQEPHRAWDIGKSR
jgi:hypothetical protein